MFKELCTLSLAVDWSCRTSGHLLFIIVTSLARFRARCVGFLHACSRRVGSKHEELSSINLSMYGVMQCCVCGGRVASELCAIVTFSLRSCDGVSSECPVIAVVWPSQMSLDVHASASGLRTNVASELSSSDTLSYQCKRWRHEWRTSMQYSITIIPGTHVCKKGKQ